jgi:hypothetical protein
VMVWFGLVLDQFLLGVLLVYGCLFGQGVSAGSGVGGLCVGVFGFPV